MIDKKRLLRTFLEYVQIDSVSGHEGAMCQRVQEDLEQLGLDVTRIKRKEGPETDGCTLMALLKGDPDADPLILGAHLDTVTPGCGIRPVVGADGYIRSSGDTILASDDKSGVAAIVEALRAVVEQKLPHRTIQVFFTIGEEIGLWGSKAVEPGMLAAKHAAILDTSQNVGRIVTCSPGQLKLTANVYGRAAHAGNAPEQGVSAILVAAKAVSNMKLQRIDSETTANIGTFEAVGSTNIISPEAKLIFEIRSRNTKELYDQAQDMVRCLETACREMGGKLDYKLSESYLGYHIPDDHPLVQQIAAACKRIGVEPFTAVTGGGSDANIFNQYGITAVNVATGMEKVHTVEERILLENLEKIAALALELVKV